MTALAPERMPHFVLMVPPFVLRLCSLRGRFGSEAPWQLDVGTRRLGGVSLQNASSAGGRCRRPGRFFAESRNGLYGLDGAYPWSRNGFGRCAHAGGANVSSGVHRLGSPGQDFHQVILTHLMSRANGGQGPAAIATSGKSTGISPPRID